MDNRLLYYITAVLCLGSVAQWVAWRLRLPAILLLLGLGFLAGRVVDVEQLIGPKFIYPIVSLAVAIVLFEGGLSLRLRELGEAGVVVLRLVTIGVVVTWTLAAVAARYLLGFDWAMASLVGAIFTVTGPTVIGPLLQHIRPDRPAGPIAKWEGIVVDPIGAALAVVAIEWVRADSFDAALSSTLIHLLAIASVGAVVGAAAAAVVVLTLKRNLAPDYLQTTLLLTMVVLSFSLANILQTESGLVAVTLFGVLLANQKSATIKHLLEFKENLRVLLISSLFIVLASLPSLDAMLAVGWPAAAFLAALLVIRIAAVFASTIGATLGWRERVFLSWLAPRGIVAAAVSSLFALELTTSHAPREPSLPRDDVATVAAADALDIQPDAAIPQDVQQQAEQLVPVTFLMIVGTVVIYGLTAGPLARRLRIARPNPQGILFVGAAPFVRLIAQALQAEGFDVVLVDTNRRNAAAARLAGLPSHCANIVSEFVGDEIDLGGVGRLLAVTPNTEVNTLSAMEFTHVFGRASVYQLAANSAETKRQETASHLRARPLFGKGVTYDLLADRVEQGAVVKKTRLSEEFTFDDFRGLYGDSAIVLFVVEPSGDLTVCTAERELAPKNGQSLISLVDRAAAERAKPDAASDTAQAAPTT